MKIYEATTIFPGIKLGREHESKENVVAVPAGKHYTHVRHKDNDGNATVNKLGKPFARKQFKDKFNKDSFYTLEYYEFDTEYDLFIGEA